MELNASNGAVGSDGTIDNALETTVSNLDGAAEGKFLIDNTGNLSVGSDNISAGDDVGITTTGDMTVGAQSVTSGSGDIDLDAGNDFTLANDGILDAGGQITIDVDQTGTVDADDGSTVELRGTVRTGDEKEVFISGGNEVDTFNITPSANTIINVEGNDPNPHCDGDEINLLNAGADTQFAGTQFNQADPHVTGSGFYTFTGAKNVVVKELEDDNVDPRIVNLSATNVDENGISTLSGQVIDLGSLGVHELRIDWRDESGVETVNLGAVSTNATIDDAGNFTVTHRYLDDNPTATPSDQYTVSVTVEDNCDDRETNQVTNLTVFNVAPSLVFDEIPFVQRNETTVVTGRYTDPGLQDTFTLEVDWVTGPGATFVISKVGELNVDDEIDSNTDRSKLRITSVDPGTGEVGFEVKHIYTVDSCYDIIVRVTDDDGGTVEDTKQALVYFLKPGPNTLGFFSFKGPNRLAGIDGIFRNLETEGFVAGVSAPDSGSGDSSVAMMPTFSGAGLPMSNISVTVRDAFGRKLATQTIDAGASGSWTVSFPGIDAARGPLVIEVSNQSSGTQDLYRFNLDENTAEKLFELLVPGQSVFSFPATFDDAFLKWIE
ncbi:MAG: hypothetical protein P1V20_05410 [Verrucomicrobiales bacterium]|nr:hypothetical protein [Verrucomicrobiales bacterium]